MSGVFPGDVAVGEISLMCGHGAKCYSGSARLSSEEFQSQKREDFSLLLHVGKSAANDLVA